MLVLNAKVWFYVFEIQQSLKWDEDMSSLSGKRVRKHATSIGRHNEVMYGPYKHYPDPVHVCGLHMYDAEDRAYIEAQLSHYAFSNEELSPYPLTPRLSTRSRKQKPQKTSESERYDPRPPLQRLRTLLLCMQHARRTIRSRMLELRRRW